MAKNRPNQDNKLVADKPPDHLSDEARQLWAGICGDHSIDDQAGLLTLQTALEAFDRMRAAQADIAKHGLLLPDRFGQLKTNSAATVERDSRSALLQGLKALQLDLSLED